MKHQITLAKVFLIFTAIWAYSISTTPLFAGNKLDSKTILMTFDQVNGFDIDTASLGVVNGHSQEVRKLAAMVLRDHSMVIQMGRNLAQNKGIEYEVNSNNEAGVNHRNKMQQLSTLSGKDFDNNYLEHETEFHTNAIAAIKTVLLPAAQDPEIKELLQAVLPGFEHHLSETKRVTKLLKSK